MNKDIRLSTCFWDHWKTIVLKEDLGYPAIESLQRLWCFAALNKPNGALIGMSARAVEVAAKWTGPPGTFITKLLELAFLEEQDGVFVLHDWEEHNGYVAQAPARSEQGKKAARARWERRQGKNAASNAECNAECNAPVPVPVPVPSPVPVPVTVVEDAPALPPAGYPEPNPNRTVPVMKITDASITAVIDLYHQLLPMCPPVRRVTQELADQIKRRIAEHDLPNLDIWRVYFTHISQCDLLTGRTPPRNGHRQPFVATLQWLTRDDNYRDIEYGKYFPTSKSSAAKQQEQPYVRH